MAKKKSAEITDEELFATIAEATNGNVLSDMESCNHFIDTGNLAVNFICSGRFIKGGIPGNRITEFYGPSSSGKSLIASGCLFGCQKMGGWPIILDCENATNGEFMERTSHLNLKKVLRYTPFTLEQAFSKIHNSVRTIREHEVKLGREPKPIVVVYDSISVSPCEREFKETNLPEEYNPTMWKKIVGRNEQPGERAKVCSKELRKLMSLLEKQGVTVLVINQTREKIGVLYGSPETTAGGGNALPFYASCRIRTATRKKIENKLKSFAGVNMHIKNVKNRTFRPFVESEGIKLYFQTGINPLSGLVSLLVQAERIVMKSAGNYLVKPEFTPTGVDEYKFKASATENLIPLQVLLDNPKLIDAESAEEIMEYMAVFQAAISDSESGAFAEKSVAFDSDGNPLIVDDEDAEELGELEE